MAKRIYLVTNSDTHVTQRPRLVRAHSQAQAVRHVARDYVAEVASQDDLVNALQAGAAVEDAGSDGEKPAPATSGDAPDHDSEGGNAD